jgi:hypothetical protein
MASAPLGIACLHAAARVSSKISTYSAASCPAMRLDLMATLRYEIMPVPNGWIVSCNGVSGSAFSTQAEAVLDTLAIAARLQANGETVEVRLLDTEQPSHLWRKLEPRDAHLFRH